MPRGIGAHETGGRAVADHPHRSPRAFAQGAHAPGATPVDDEAADLIPDTVSTLAQLNAFEQTNILAATEWALRPARRPQPARVLTTEYLLGLHRRMFGQTWRWAGELRRTYKNIGADSPERETRERRTSRFCERRTAVTFPRSWRS